MKAWNQKRALSKVLGGKGSPELRQWEVDYYLVEYEGLFEEYLEMGKFPLLYLIKNMKMMMITQGTNVNNMQRDKHM